MDKIEQDIYDKGKETLKMYLIGFTEEEREAAKEIEDHLEKDEYSFDQFSKIDSAIRTLQIPPTMVVKWADPMIENMEEHRIADWKRISGEPCKARNEYAPLLVWFAPNGCAHVENDPAPEEGWMNRPVFELKKYNKRRTDSKWACALRYMDSTPVSKLGCESVLDPTGLNSSIIQHLNMIKLLNDIG